MKYRTSATWLGLAIGCLGLVVGLVGCASPHTYYCDDGGGGPHGLSGRYGDSGVAACDTHAVVDHGMIGMEPAVVDDECYECGGARPYGRHTLTGMLHSMVTCDAGCGDIYWGEWSYDPPDQCDPCNNHGDFVGRGCCGPSGHHKFWLGLRGVRDCPAGCANGCDVCQGGGYAGEPSCGSEPGCGCDDCAMGTSSVMEGDLYDTGEPTLEQFEPIPASPPQVPPTSISTARHAPRPYYQRNPNSRLVRRPER